MTTGKTTLLALLLLCLGLNSFKQKPEPEMRPDFKKYYDRFNVEGSFVVFNEQQQRYTFYNPQQFKQAFSPASTFKICNSLIGLETGVIKNEHFIIAWDSVSRQNPAWNQDHDLKTAFKNSTVWYYQELARRVGATQMKHWLDKAGYGNADTSGGIDRFWLTGGLRISPEQQIMFLKRLHNNQLPFSERTVNIVKQIMIAETTPYYTLRAKTGWGVQNNKDIGWYVGYVETKNNVYYFANCIQPASQNNKQFAEARINITRLILADLNIIKP